MRFESAIGCLLALLTSSVVHATVNTEKMRMHDVDTGYSGHVEGNFSISQGNNESIDLGAGVMLQYERRFNRLSEEEAVWTRDLKFLNASIQQAHNSEATFTNDGFLHLRWTHMWRRRIGSEFFTQYQFNEFQRLKRRQLFGFAARTVLSNSKSSRLIFGSGYMFELEHLVDDGLAGRDLNGSFHRWNNYASIQLNLERSGIVFSNTVYAQPRFDQPSDYRLLNEGEVRFQITQSLSLGTTLTFVYDSRPPEGVKPEDLNLVNSIRVNF